MDKTAKRRLARLDTYLRDGGSPYQSDAPQDLVHYVLEVFASWGDALTTLSRRTGRELPQDARLEWASRPRKNARTLIIRTGPFYDLRIRAQVRLAELREKFNLSRARLRMYETYEADPPTEVMAFMEARARERMKTLSTTRLYTAREAAKVARAVIQDSGMSLSELGALIGVSRQRVHQLKEHAPWGTVILLVDALKRAGKLPADYKAESNV